MIQVDAEFLKLLPKLRCFPFKITAGAAMLATREDGIFSTLHPP